MNSMEQYENMTIGQMIELTNQYLDSQTKSSTKNYIKSENHEEVKE